jgi:hypothetical protein
MAVGHSDDLDPEGALAEIFDACDAGLMGATPKAGLLLSTWAADHRAMIDAVRARYPGIELAGSSSGGEMSSVIGFSEDSISLALFASDAIDVVAGLGRDLAADPVAAARQAVAGAMARTDKKPRVCVALPSIGGVEAGVILDALRAALGPGVPVVGGGAAPRDPSASPDGSGSYQFVGDALATDSLAILLFAGPVAVSFGVETGWRPVGPRATVTRSSSSTVQEIDGRPALEFYERYVGSGQPPVANPLAVFEDPTSDRSYLRTPVAYDRETGSIGFFGAVPEGSTVQLTMAAVDQIFEGARASVAEALAGFPAGSRPDGALLFSCATRKYLLGTRAGQEIDVVRALLGERVPVSGLYCMGEIAPAALTGSSRFHNATMVSLLLGDLGPEPARTA